MKHRFITWLGIASAALVVAGLLPPTPHPQRPRQRPSQTA
jgi:hypothetical protein